MKEKKKKRKEISVKPNEKRCLYLRYFINQQFGDWKISSGSKVIALPMDMDLISRTHIKRKHRHNGICL